MSDTVRLNRYLAERGIASRRHCDRIIQEGAVEVDGSIVMELGTRVTPGTSEVRVDGVVVADTPRLYYAYYKPKGVLCTESTREKRTRVHDLIAERIPGRVHMIGRLDEDSEGLLLLTNDGDFAQFVAHPRNEVPKTYAVTVRGSLSSAAVAKLRKGLHLAEGRTRPMKIKPLKRTKNFTNLLVTMTEGKNREVRRVFAKLGHPVRQLKRVRIGPVTLEGVRRGGLRKLTTAERRALLNRTGDIQQPERAGRRRKPARGRR